MEFHHVPILLPEVLEGLAIRPDGIYVDGTVGGAGHSREIAKRLGENGRLICLDQDEEAVQAASERLSGYPMAKVIKSNYLNMGTVLDDLGIGGVDGILLDLGVSSHQLDDASRGFSYREDAPLDMRMDRDTSLTAREVVNTYSEAELRRVLRDYGEEPFAAQIARKICETRQDHPIETTFQLNDCIRSAIPAAARRKGGHPSKRTYQAIRIEINQELSVLENSLDHMIDRLNPGGRICILTFHSLEDRIVKTAFRTAEHPCICPPEFPVCVCGRKSKGKVLTRKPIEPSEQEQERNPRSRSAKLRIFEKAQKGVGVWQTKEENISI